MRVIAVSILLFMASGLKAEEPKPVSPFAPNVQAPPRADARPGTASLSDGKTFSGLVMFTRGRKLEVYEDARQKWHAFALEDIARLDNELQKESTEREWRFKEGGNDEKVYTGRVFVDHKYRLHVTLADGKKITGHVRGSVFYVQPKGGEPKRFFLRHDYRSSFGGKASEIVYLTSLVLGASPNDTPSKKKE